MVLTIIYIKQLLIDLKYEKYNIYIFGHRFLESMIFGVKATDFDEIGLETTNKNYLSNKEIGYVLNTLARTYSKYVNA